MATSCSWEYFEFKTLLLFVHISPSFIVYCLALHFGQLSCIDFYENRMKKIYLTFITLTFFGVAHSVAQTIQVINLHSAALNQEIEVINREITIFEDGPLQGLRLSKDYDEGIAWFKGLEFSNGTIEFDVRGEDVKQHSFVGIAFHGQNDSTYDAVYLRPFHFLTQDTVLKKRMIQYISLPDYTWRRLRAESPDQYENVINQTLDPNGWVHMRVVVRDSTVSTYINDSKEPSLVVQKVTPAHKGWFGFYVADTSGGDFANLSIVRE